MVIRRAGFFSRFPLAREPISLVEKKKYTPVLRSIGILFFHRDFVGIEQE